MKKFVFVLIAFYCFSVNLFSEDEVTSHKEQWDFYLTNVDNMPSSIFLDLGYRSEAPIKGYKQVAWISIKLKFPTENGMSSSDEMDTLNEIEESLMAMMGKKYRSKYVGRLTSDGIRSFYFYIADKGIKENDVKSAFKKFTSYEYQFGSKLDETWDGYINLLYPNPRQYQVIQNRHVLDNIQSNGDDLTRERRVDHWIYFPTVESQQRYKAEILKLGFSIQKEDSVDSEDQNNFVLHIYRVDHVDYDSINAVTLELFDLAETMGVDYDGWETSVEK